MAEKHDLKLTNLKKIFWPDEGWTKGDLIDYYDRIATIILPYLVDRPESMNRHPNGILGKSFYQKDVDHKVPSWLETLPITSQEDGKTRNFLLCQNKDSLLYMANLGCIEINPWNSRKKHLDHPDYIVIDLDPEDLSFSFVCETALAVKKVLDQYEIFGLPKTSGATGIHIYIPLGANYEYEQARNFAKILATLVHREVPEFTSIERSPSKRQKKVYVDYLQNAKGQTLAAPYSLRPRSKAPVSTPLEWGELENQFLPEKFNIKSIFSRLKEKGDLFRPILERENNIKKILEKMS